MNFVITFVLLFFHLQVCSSAFRETLQNRLLRDSPEPVSQSAFPGLGAVFENCTTPEFVCPNENITYWLYTRDTQDNPWQLSEYDLNTLKEAPVKRGLPWKVIIHGYTGWKDYAPNPEIRPKYFEHGEYNIISVDYNPLVLSPCYIQAVRNVPLVSNCTGQLLNRLVELGIMDRKNLHIIGFSLGAQVSGLISRYYKYGPIPRISGLDPALPLFMKKSAYDKLDSSDADFVDVIHTNAGWRGQLEKTGHVDFYPNGGYTQPGCNESSEYGGTGSCYHARAPIYFGESIDSIKGFWGVPCQNWLVYSLGFCPGTITNQIEMGDPCPLNARGTYYLNTKSEPPFALGRQSDGC